MKIISSITNRSYTFRFLYRASVICLGAGVALGIYTMVTAVPAVQTVFADWSARTTPDMYHKATSTTAAINNPETIEAYYQEELKKLEEKYVQAHKDEARMNAINRVQADLEAEKEIIRERELFQ